MRCTAKKADGQRCKAASLTGGRCCAFHSQPGRAAELGRRGGARRALFPIEDLRDFAPPRTAADVAEIVAQTLVDARMGRVDHKRANSISGLAAVLTRIIETASLEARVSTLEKNQSRSSGVGHGRS
jgi:hypothetical protein